MRSVVVGAEAEAEPQLPPVRLLVWKKEGARRAEGGMRVKYEAALSYNCCGLRVEVGYEAKLLLIQAWFLMPLE